MSFVSRLALAHGTVDRLAEHREDEEWLARAWADRDARVVVVTADGLRVSDDRTRLATLPTSEAPDGERYLLGREPSGRLWFAVRSSGPPSTSAAGTAEPGATATLRAIGSVLPADEAELAVHAVALANWHSAHTHCPRCGAPTVVAVAGHQRRCTRDDSRHFPRTDPAVIVMVTDPQDRALLGRQGAWLEGRFSTLAGFVEPGESAEQAVVREVREEAAVALDSVSYLGSQPWPFPASLMLGFIATCSGSQDPHPDGSELVEARWFGRDEVRQGVASGELIVPPTLSIARRLVEHWLGGVLPDGPSGASWRPTR